MQHEEKIIIWAFSGTGKSAIADGKRIVDADDEYFRFHLFDPILPQDIQSEYRHILDKPYPENLILFVKEVQADIVLLNCHTSLLQHFENVYLVYPSADLKETFLSRYRNRGDNISYITYMADTYEGILEALSVLPYPRYIIAEQNTYLKDIILNEWGEVNIDNFKVKNMRTISRDGR